MLYEKSSVALVLGHFRYQHIEVFQNIQNFEDRPTELELETKTVEGLTKKSLVPEILIL